MSGAAAVIDKYAVRITELNQIPYESILVRYKLLCVCPGDSL